MQLFYDSLFPASSDQPLSAFSFVVLDYFYIDAMECKTAAHSFFRKLCRMTNNAFPNNVPVGGLNHFTSWVAMLIFILKNRYRELMRISRQWRDLLARKRFGFGHDTDRTLAAGDLSLFCPACPQPGINLPDGWQTSAEPWVICFVCIVFMGRPVHTYGLFWSANQWSRQMCTGRFIACHGGLNLLFNWAGWV